MFSGAGKIAPAPDPDTIYQFDVAVGHVVAAEDPIAGHIKFGRIEDAVQLDMARNFEYRNYVLKYERADVIGNTAIMGKKSLTLINVTCEIVGRSQQLSH